MSLTGLPTEIFNSVGFFTLAQSQGYNGGPGQQRNVVITLFDQLPHIVLEPASINLIGSNGRE